MKLEFSKNQSVVQEVRSQITDVASLKKFDDFVAKHNAIDFTDSKDTAAARDCCNGDECCDIVIQLPPMRMN